MSPNYYKILVKQVIKSIKKIKINAIGVVHLSYPSRCNNLENNIVQIHHLQAVVTADVFV